MSLWQISIFTGIEFLGLMLVVCVTAGTFIKDRIKPILIYAPIYLLIFATRGHIHDIVLFTTISTSLIVFIKMVFKKKMSTTIIIAFISMFLSILIPQVLIIFAIGLIRSSPVDFVFSDSLMVMAISLAFCMLCYFYLPLYRVIYKLKKMDRFLNFIVVFLTITVISIILYLISITDFFYLFNHRRTIADFATFIIGFSSILIVTYYCIAKYIWAFKERRLALKRFSEFENLPADKKIKLHDDYEMHLQVTQWLSHINDNEKAIWYKDTYLSNFEEDEKSEDALYMEEQPIFNRLDDKVLAAYLYVKMKYLQSLGINCRVSVPFESRKASKKTKIKPYKLLEALDILIDEALATTSKENSDLRIFVWKRLDDNGRPAIDICNKNDLLSSTDTTRMVVEKYSLKTKKVGGLLKLSVISEEYDCYLSLQDKEIFHINEFCNYLRLRYVL